MSALESTLPKIPLSNIANTITTQGSFDIKRLLSKNEEAALHLLKGIEERNIPFNGRNHCSFLVTPQTLYLRGLHE